MTQTLAEGLNLALYGIGTVFVFLAILVFAIIIMSRIVSATTAKASENQKTEPIKLAVISAAIQQHRKRN